MLVASTRDMLNPPPADPRRLSLLPLLLLSICFAGCASSSAVRLGTQVFDPLPEASEVVVYTDLADVPQPYSKVGRIVGEGSSSVSFAEIVDEIRADARKLGANVVVLLGSSLLSTSCTENCVAGRRAVHALAVRIDR